MKNRTKSLFVFITIFCVLEIVAYTIANQKYPNRNNYVLSDKLLYGQRPKNDACYQSIYGEPLRANDNHIKINFYCSNNRSSKNTISLNVIKAQNIQEVINEITRINNFDFDNNFKCYFEGKIIESFNQKIIPEKTIDCLSPEVKISDLYKDEI